MFDIFTDEIEVTLKEGITNLYWYKDDLKRVWFQVGVDPKLWESLNARPGYEGGAPTKRQLMSYLYEELRQSDHRKRLEISRNFVRKLIEHKDFVPQDPKHRVEIAERCALKLREIIAEQQKQKEYQEKIRRRAIEATKETYHSQLLKVREHFVEITSLEGQKRGYAFEKLFTKLMQVSGIPVEKPFKITGEQIDGAIKYDGHYYLIELKWVKKKCNQSTIASLYLKVEGKMDARGLFIAMEGYTDPVLTSLPKGKEIKVLLLEGIHLANVIYGIYTFQELLEHAINQASLKGEVYCPPNISP